MELLPSMPNFPYVITREMIEVYGEPTDNPHCFQFRYDDYIIQASRYPNTVYWVASVREKGGWGKFIVGFYLKDDSPFPIFKEYHGERLED